MDITKILKSDKVFLDLPVLDTSCAPRLSMHRHLKPAAHESYLLSKNSLVNIGVSKIPPCAAKFWEIFGTRDEKLSKFRHTREEIAYANRHEWLLAQQIALVYGRLKQHIYTKRRILVRIDRK